MNRLKELLCRHGAADAGIVKYSDCEIINKRLAGSMGFTPRSVCVGIIPYYSHHCDLPHSVSSYALAFDYHTLIKNVCEKVLPEAKQIFPNASFSWFGDHSPINEKLAAAKAGLGIIGEHSLLITPKYSSFVFLFEIITDIEFDVDAHEIKGCEKCGKCVNACPVGMYDKTACLSALTQKKGALDSGEEELIRNSGCAWGCDICQTVCPHTVKAINSGTIYTSASWFSTDILSDPTKESVSNESDFKQRAYSWRGPATILRNIDIVTRKKQ